MADDHERRLSTVEAIIDTKFTTIAESMRDTNLYLAKLFSEVNDTKTGIALVQQSQEKMEVYQVKCDKERKDLDDRLKTTEGYQSRQYRNAGIIALCCSSLGIFSPKLAEKIMALFT